jgi:hypothetical protein
MEEDNDMTLMDLRRWPSPFPRLWAYTRLFQNKLAATLCDSDHSPTRINDELPFSTRYYHYFWSNDPTEIIPGLFLGSAKNAADWDSIQRNDIKCIINVTTEIENFFEASSDVEYKNVLLSDTKEAIIANDVEAAFESAVDHIHFSRDASPVLVHCFMGASRSVALVCAYLMKYHGKTPAEAYNMVKEKRDCIAMNENFYNWLGTNLEPKKIEPMHQID